MQRSLFIVMSSVLFACNVGSLTPDTEGDAGHDMTRALADSACELDPEFGVVAGIVQRNCLLGGCHGDPPGASEFAVREPGSEFSVWTALTESKLVARCDPEQSSLLNPHGSNEPAYGPQETEVLSDWISGGAKCCASDPGC